MIKVVPKKKKIFLEKEDEKNELIPTVNTWLSYSEESSLGISPVSSTLFEFPGVAGEDINVGDLVSFQGGKDGRLVLAKARGK